MSEVGRGAVVRADELRAPPGSVAVRPLRVTLSATRARSQRRHLEAYMQPKRGTDAKQRIRLIGESTFTLRHLLPPDCRGRRREA